MTVLAKNLFCGSLGIGLREILGVKGTATGIESWFWGTSSCLTHMGRIAVRKACELINTHSGDEILMPAYNCGSEIDPVIKGGATVVLYRVDRSSMIDIDDLQLRITARTKAIYVTHYFGFPQQVAKIKELCEAHSVYLIEDCALSLFSSNYTEKLGTTGDIAIFSLTKTLPVPDGGVLVVNNSELIKKSWNLRSPSPSTVFSRTLPLVASRGMNLLSSCTATYPFYILALSMRRGTSTSGQHRRKLHATTGPEMLPSMYYNESLSNRTISSFTERILQTCDSELIILRRRRNFASMLSLLKGLDYIEPLFIDLPPGVCPLWFPVLVDNRDELQSKLFALGIDVRAWWKGYHRGLPWEDFPDACSLKNRVLALPVHQELSSDEIIYIVQHLIKLAS